MTKSRDLGDLVQTVAVNLPATLGTASQVLQVNSGANGLEFASVALSSLSENLDTNGHDIVTSGNADLDLAPNGTGKVVVRGNTNSGKIVFNCENNSHGVTLASPPHSASATYEVKLPDSLGLTNASAIVTADTHGVVTFDNGTIEESTAITSSSEQATINLRDGNNFTHTLTENVTYTFSNPSASGRVSSFTLKVVQDSTARTIIWPNSVNWAGGSAPTLSTGSGDCDLFVFITYDGGTAYYGFTAGQDMY